MTDHGWRLHAFAVNPVRAGIVSDPLDDPWTSFSGYCRKSRALEWVSYERVLADHGPGRQSVRRRRYAKFVRAGTDEDLRSPWSDPLGYRRREVAWALGYRSPSSVAQAQRRVEEDAELMKRAERVRRRLRRKG